MKISFRGTWQGRIIRLLLRLLNSKLLNQSPCKYGYINGLDAVSYQDLLSEYKQQPEMTVGELIDSINRFNSCPLYEDRIAVIEPDGSFRKGDVWDVHQLRQSLTPRHKTDESPLP